MPYQSAFTLLIIGGAFMTAGALIGTINWAYEGKRKRSFAQDQWQYHMEQRDLMLKRYAKDAK